MIRGLGWVALAGFGVGAAFLSLAFAIGGRELDDLRLDLSLGASCDGGGQANDGRREKQLAWDDGDSVELSLPGTVYFRGGQGSDVTVRGPVDIVDHVEIKHGRISLYCRSRGRTRDLEVTLPGRAFRSIRIAGSGKLVMENVDQPELALAIAGSGSIRAQGKVDRATVRVAGSGDARLGELTAKQITIDISGSGTVEARPKDSADIKIAGSGDVRLLERPADLRSKISGSGRVTGVP
jgi:hypothetical protein